MPAASAWTAHIGVHVSPFLRPRGDQWWSCPPRTEMAERAPRTERSVRPLERVLTDHLFGR